MSDFDTKCGLCDSYRWCGKPCNHHKRTYPWNYDDEPDEAPVVITSIEKTPPPVKSAPIKKNIAKSKKSYPESADKKLISIRLDKDVLEELRASGRGWQTRVNGILRQSLRLKASEELD